MTAGALVPGPQLGGAFRVVAIGASWGGLDALRVVLGGLPAALRAAVVVAQHRAADGDHRLLSHLLDAASALPVRDAEDRAVLRAGEVLLAPPGYHLLVEPGEVALSVDPPVWHSRPSIDVLLESVAEAYGAAAIGVVLTGANADGADGLRAVRRRGGAAIVQDPDEAERAEMPRAALAAVPDARVLRLGDIAACLVALTGLAVGGEAR